jgi:hypothetical protein|tara:strand:+ start:963 stop:1340 length:378 start_codon:yes stop_codon:yes gene_type:complete
MAEIPAPKILRECRKIISAIPMPIIPLMDKMSKSEFENWASGMRGTPIIKHVSMNSNSPIILFTGFITMGETRSPIFLKMIIANAQNMAERSEHISPMYGIVVNYYLKNEVKFREIYYLLYNKII